MRIAKRLAFTMVLIVAGCGRPSSENLSPTVQSPEAIEQARQEYQRKAEENARREEEYLGTPRR